MENDLAMARPIVDMFRSFEARGHVFADVAAGDFLRREPGTVRGAWGDAIGAEDSPVVSREIPRDEISATLGGHQMMRLHSARGCYFAVV